MSLSFAVMVFWSDRTVIQPDAVEAPGSWRTWNFPVMCSGPPPRMVTLETCQLVVTWQHCWHGNDVEKLKLCMDYGQSIYGNLSIALLQKNDTGVSPRYSYKLFLYLLFYIPEKWQILPCFLMFYSQPWAHLSLNFFFYSSFWWQRGLRIPQSHSHKMVSKATECICYTHPVDTYTTSITFRIVQC